MFLKKTVADIGMKEDVYMQEFLQEESKKEDDLDIEIIDLDKGDFEPEKEETEQDGSLKEEPFNLVKEIFSLLGTMVIAAITVFLLKEFVIINAYIPSGSMENTIYPGDRIIGNRLAYLSEEPQRGDIVIFKYPDDEKQLFVKRVIGLPGERVTIDDAKIYIGDEQIALEEYYLKEEWTVANGTYTFDVPEGSYLVLGDNRNNSRDARYWENTYVAEDKILGEAVFRYWPFDGIGMLK